jgi:hypothetical protein
VRGNVVDVEEIIPNVTHRDGYGYYFQAQIDGRRYFESLQTDDAAVAAARAKVKRSEAVAKGQAPAGPYVPGGGAKILGGGLEALKRDELAGAGGGS